MAHEAPAPERATERRPRVSGMEPAFVPAEEREPRSREDPLGRPHPSGRPTLCGPGLGGFGGLPLSRGTSPARLDRSESETTLPSINLSACWGFSPKRSPDLFILEGPQTQI